MKYRLIYFGFSLLIILVGIFSIISWGFKIGIDFTGGTVIEYKINESISEEDLKKEIEQTNVNVGSIQKTSTGSFIFKLPPLNSEEKTKIEESLNAKYLDSYEELRYENVGPSLGPELIRKTILALAISSAAILLWVAYQFKNIKFGVSALLAMLHDSIILVGSISFFGHFYGAEVDFLFVTAILTILSFSVHDTIVVYDRIRESQKKHGGTIYEIANKAISETMVRSLNNSFTIIYMLVALVLLGGESIKWFAVSLLVGTIAGTYSSPFVAVPILVTWDNLTKRFKK